MKKLAIILVCLLISSSLFAFEQGQKVFGGNTNLSYNSTKANSDADATSIFNADIFGGYFLLDNIMAKAIIDYYSYTHGDYSSSRYLFGVGGDYLFDQFFAGAAFLFAGDSYSNSTDSSESATYLSFEAGYLLEMVEHVFLTIRADYKMGFGDYGGDKSGSNEETSFGVGAGFSVFLPN